MTNLVDLLGVEDVRALAEGRVTDALKAMAELELAKDARRKACPRCGGTGLVRGVENGQTVCSCHATPWSLTNRSRPPVRTGW